MKGDEKIKQSLSMSAEQMDKFDKSKISYIAMKDGEKYKIKNETKEKMFSVSPELSSSQKFKNESTNINFNDTYYTNDNNMYSIYSPNKRCYGRLIADKGNIMIYESGIETINCGNNESGEKFECVAGDEEFEEKMDNCKKFEKKNKIISLKKIINNRNFIAINSENTGSVVYRNEDENCPVFPFNSGMKKRYRYGRYRPPNKKPKYKFNKVYPNDLDSFSLSRDK